MDPRIPPEYVTQGVVVAPDAALSSHTTSYIRNSKAIASLWGIFTICFVILVVVIFVQPQWIGDTEDSRGTGYFGLWKHCVSLRPESGELICKGRVDDFATIITPAFRAATVFTGIGVAISFLCLAAMLLFFFVNAATVFHICAWMQLFAGICVLVGVLCFPAGWDAPEVRAVCGQNSGDFNLGGCGIRWAYLLACIATADAFVLATLAFVLGTRYIKMSNALEGLYSSSIYKGKRRNHQM
ncbi:unnamed protein product [Cyprideis torosa]|uniref:Uncharacterized protein n=1 Tax=Cyprideis torosa TaxID=163714 RepID=A0A7R8ZJC7_9CRUS|nr:unnamed protein product [Cyprideis torosa]CAG0879545.1 unnamed protein product [Cyprideis torosa]